MVTIRELTVDDLSAVIEINEQSMPENYPMDIWEYMTYITDHCYIASTEGKIIGYIITVDTISNPWLPLIFDVTPSLFNVCSIAVSPEYRKKGVATKLMQASLDSLPADNQRAVELYVHSSNFSARGMYEKFGFVVKQEFKNYYSDGDDGLRMERL